MFIKSKTGILILVLAITTRLALSFLPSFETDISAYRFWSQRLVENGLSGFYSPSVFTNNPSGYLYIYWATGFIKKIFFPDINYLSSNYDILLKLPTNIADILSGLVIFLILKRKVSEKLALIGFSAYVFNPAIFFNSSIWGQYDGFSTLFLLVSCYVLVIKKTPVLSTMLFAIAWTIKPQTISFTPVLVLLILRLFPPQKWLYSLATFIATALLIYLPFFPKNPFYGLIFVNFSSANLFNCTTCFAFNFWGIFGNWGNDLNQFLGISYLFWGIVLLIIFLIPLLLLKTKNFQEPLIYLTTSISVISFFTLLTRVHERYIFPVFAFLLLASILLKSKTLIGFYIFISSLSLLNLYLPYAYYNKHLNLTSSLINQLLTNFKFLSAIFVLTFLSLYFYFFKIQKKYEDK